MAADHVPLLASSRALQRGPLPTPPANNQRSTTRLPAHQLNFNRLTKWLRYLGCNRLPLRGKQELKDGKIAEGAFRCAHAPYALDGIAINPDLTVEATSCRPSGP